MEKSIPLLLLNEDKLVQNINDIDKTRKRLKLRTLQSNESKTDKSLSDAIQQQTKNLSKEVLNPDILTNISLSEITLPGAIISYMLKKQTTASENEIYEYILPKINDLRKSDGGKYKGNLKKVVKSTLYSSGLFYKKESNGEFYFKEKEGFAYMIRNTEKLMSKHSNSEKLFLINKKRKRG
jgi:hypothetical protein